LKKRFFIPLIAVLIITVYSIPSEGWNQSCPLIIDHLSTDIGYIPAQWVDSVKVNIDFHYAHTSHGAQLTTGLGRIESVDDFYAVEILEGALPDAPGELCIFDGQVNDDYVTPEEYWETAAGMNSTREVLDNNPSINVSGWSWCTQVEYYTEAQIQAYLDSISKLEDEYPDVTFIYMTGNAQATGQSGLSRYLRNEQIRQYCSDNNKVLFDFADLDSWYLNPDTGEWEQATYQYDGYTVPVEHPQFNGTEAAHTTYESCEQKGRAAWWMLASIAGWVDWIASAEEKVLPPAVALRQNYPNPFNPSTSIEYHIDRSSMVELSVYDINGRLVRTLFSGRREQGDYRHLWNGTPAGCICTG
jgi:hypothetical protein